MTTGSVPISIRHPRFDAFVAHVTERQAAGLPRAELAEQVRRALAELVMDPGWLPDAARVGSQDRYMQHILHVADDRSFSVVGLVWYPGQLTPIHDHVTWCVVGVLEGEESQTRYHLMADAGGRYLAVSGNEIAPRGHCSSLVPPEENIHKVMNAGDACAISIHVYGADIEALGTSINQCFDDLPIREVPAGSPAAQSWRDERHPARST